jgi:ADP-ribose pyrophosphatase YjhB (NUDIX family)
MSVPPALRPLTTVDVVIMTIRSGVLNVLLVQRPNVPDDPFPGMWALPGGFVNMDIHSSLEDCALKKLAEKTGVRTPYLEQVGSWGNARRDPRGWSTTHVYAALLDEQTLHLQKGGNAADLLWTPVVGNGVAMPLAFDHATLLAAAVERIQSKTEYTSLPVYLLPETFTLGELQTVYEIVLGRKLEKKAFRTRMLAVPLLEEIGEMKHTGRRPAQMYRLKERRNLAYFARTFRGTSDQADAGAS